jgi:hypothetical protein
MTERWHCAPGSNIWHSSSLCSVYPRRDYWSRAKKPRDGELCAECGELQNRARRSWLSQSEHIL